MTAQPRTIHASAPGSIMITGEHAVVYGHPAIVAAIEQRIDVTLTARTDRTITLRSAIAAELTATLDDLPTDGAYRFVLAAIARYLKDLPSGFDLDIRSEIDPTLGLGSSAAVTIATLGAVAHFAGQSQAGLHSAALDIVRHLQGRGSGADLAASVTGGMVSYKIPSHAGDAALIEPLPTPPAAMSLKYCGYKTPTGEVLKRVAEKMVGNEAKFDALYARMGACSAAAIEAAETGQWAAFYDDLTQYQILMEDLGVCDDTLRAIIEAARVQSVTQAAKISGSGLGDCVLAFGQPEGFVPITLAKQGLLIDG